METKKCSEHIIGYIDLLGAKEKIKTDSNFYLQQLDKTIFFVNSVIKLDSDLIPFNEIKYKAFSDNVIFAVEINEHTSKYTAFLTVFTMCSYFQRMLVQECRWLSRGAITMGDFYIDSNVVWGDALIRAYELESKVAVFPRVILDPQILISIDAKEMPAEIQQLVFDNLERDNDGFFFVDYTMKHSDDISKFLNIFEDVCNQTNHTAPPIWQKIYWVKNYIEKKRKELRILPTQD